MSWYSKPNLDQRREYINKQNERRRDRKRTLSTSMDEDFTNAMTSTVHKRTRTTWLLKGLLTVSIIQGSHHYKPNCSVLHILQNTPSCIKCGAKRFQYEPPTFCCYKGQVELAQTTVPEELLSLFTSQTKEAIDFRKHIRMYNSVFSFTSFGAKIDKDLASARKGGYTFRAQGQIYHNLPSLLPRDGSPSFFQLYFYDSDNEVKNRMRIFKDEKMTEEMVNKVMHFLHGNPYSQFLRTLKDYPSFDDLQIVIAKDAKLDQRVYNAPSADQVAAIWVEGNNVNIPFERDIIINTHSGDSHRIKHYFGCYDPLQYPLLFPKGETGWHQNIKRQLVNVESISAAEATVYEPNDLPITQIASVHDILRHERPAIGRVRSRNVSCREYYCYKLQIRALQVCILLLAGRLFHQYIVDMYVKLETTRLDYCRRHQLELRSEVYQGIVDCVNAGETRGDQVGQRIVLPASFIGGPRDMRRRYLNAMALVQRFGRPDLFITITCNPEWKEIQDELQPGQEAHDRPDLTSRVFRAKLQDLKDQLFTKKIFGAVAARVHVVEFQKRGLPHVHMLIIMKNGFKINTPDDYDKFVCAELPDENTHPELFAMVVKHMMHGPCGNLNKNCPCMVNGECSKHYPRSFCSKTTQGKDSYPLYRRTNNGRQVRVRNQMLDNKWVVPYNPYLLSRYNCHLNVEVCSSLKSVKYLYKYIYKGHDKVAVYISHEDGDQTIDEIKTFQDARWVSAQEAIWQIYEFDLNEINPSVINLHLHLPNKHLVCYWKNQNLQNIISWDHASKTMLTEFFHTCLHNPDARQFLYSEFPEHYTWNQQDKSWSKRKNIKVIGRVNGANPVEGERYYMRILLNHIRGPTSFEDLLTVNHIRCKSFKESALKRGLLESDKSASECMEEASAYQMPQSLRRLFATILVYCEPADVKKLWEDYFEVMSEDFRRDGSLSVQNHISSTLDNLNYFLESMGKSVRDYDLPIQNSAYTHQTNSYPREIRDELSLDIPLEDLCASSKLNKEQQAAYNVILDRVNSRKAGVFFLDGPGGTGKTFLYRALIATIRSKGEIVIVTATSGVAASLMAGGRTAHSRFKIPIITTETSTCNIPKQSGLAKLIKKSKLIIWDEAPMAKRFAIETLDRSLKDLMSNSGLFGGKIVVFGGDFRQVLPVVRRGTRRDTVEASLVRSTIWHDMEKLTLTQNMRAMADPNFGTFLLNLGNGDEPTTTDDMILLPDSMVIKYDSIEAAEQILIDNIFPAIRENYGFKDYITSRALLTTTNEYVERLNEKLISMFPGDTKEFCSFDEAIDDTNHYYQEEFLNSLMPNGLPPHKLLLKLNCPIMLLRNLDPSNGLCNGTRLICRGYNNNVIQAEIAIGQHEGKHVFIPRIPLSPAESEGYPFLFRRKQFPIRLCFAMTINKAQGQTIQHVGVYLPEHVFSHGQLYVALSRGVSMSTTKVLVAAEKSKTRKGTYTKNVVYKEVFFPERHDLQTNLQTDAIL